MEPVGIPFGIADSKFQIEDNGNLRSAMGNSERSEDESGHQATGLLTTGGRRAPLEASIVKKRWGHNTSTILVIP